MEEADLLWKYPEVENLVSDSLSRLERLAYNDHAISR
jgi:hypothetical protein